MTAQALIIGAGINGLGAASALHRIGFRVTVFEQASVCTEEDTGMVLTAPAAAMLSSCLSPERVQTLGTPLTRFHFNAPTGDPLMRIPIAHQACDTTQAVHRPDLWRAVKAALPPNTIQFGKTFVGLSQNDARVTAHFADGASVTGDLLIGADGIHSTVAAALDLQADPDYAGYLCWQGMSDRDELVSPHHIFESSGGGRRFGAVNLGDGRIYWYACLNLPAHTNFAHRTREELVMRYLSFHAPVAALIESTPDHRVSGRRCYERAPLKHWSRGRVTLLGNAAHPMSPVLGQSISEGLEDSITLAACLDAGHDVATALRHYEAHRAPRAALVQRTAQHAARLGQVQHPLACSLRNLALRYTPRFSINRHYNQILGLQLQGKVTA